MKPTLFLTASALCLGSTAAFTSVRPDARPATGLALARDGADRGATLAASALAAAYLLVGAASGAAALAPDDVHAGAPAFADVPSVVLAGRSGGRAGGRSMPRAAPRSAPRSNTVYNTRTVIQAPPVMMGGGYGYGGYGYGGNGLGLGTMMGINAIGNGMREGRQNEMIAEERAELRNSQGREQELAARVRQLEMMQMQQAGGGGGQAAPQVIVVPPPAAVEAVLAK